MAPSRRSPCTPPDNLSSSPKFALKGFSLSSTSIQQKPSLSKARAQPKSSLGKRRRGGFLGQSGSGSEGYFDDAVGGVEVVSAFGEEGAVTTGGSRDWEEVLVIPKLEDKNWRGKRKSKNLLPQEVQRQISAERDDVHGDGRRNDVDIRSGGEKIIEYGLRVNSRGVADDIPAEELTTNSNIGIAANDQEAMYRAKTQDELAIAALTGVTTTKQTPSLVIMNHNIEQQGNEPITEGDAYRAAIASAPDVSTLEDYERVPVEEFGAAMLRGMGWNGDMVKGGREVKRRQNLLGLGARQLKDAEELGAWVQKSDIKRLDTRLGKDRRERKGEGGKMEGYRIERERRREAREGGSGSRSGREDKDRSYRWASNHRREQDHARDRGSGSRGNDRHGDEYRRARG